MNYVRMAHIIMINRRMQIYVELKYLVFSARYSLVNAENETYNKAEDEKTRAESGFEGAALNV